MALPAQCTCSLFLCCREKLSSAQKQPHRLPPQVAAVYRNDVVPCTAAFRTMVPEPVG